MTWHAGRHLYGYGPPFPLTGEFWVPYNCVELEPGLLAGRRSWSQGTWGTLPTAKVACQFKFYIYCQCMHVCVQCSILVSVLFMPCLSEIRNTRRRHVRSKKLSRSLASRVFVVPLGTGASFVSVARGVSRRAHSFIYLEASRLARQSSCF